MVAFTSAPFCLATNRQAVSPLVLLAVTTHTPSIDGALEPVTTGAAVGRVARKGYEALRRRYSPSSWPPLIVATRRVAYWSKARVRVVPSIRPDVEVVRRSPLK